MAIGSSIEPLETRRLLAAAYPTALEQFMVELINRARANPSAEAARLGIDLNEGLPAGTISPVAKQPLAINPLLTDAARNHVEYLRSTGKFQHEGPNNNNPKDRMEAAGYTFAGGWGYAENLAVRIGGIPGESYYAGVVDNLHAGLFRDTEIAGRGHRKNLLNGAMREVGPGLSVGPYSYNGGASLTSLLVGQDFAYSGNNQFLTGVAFTDGVIRDSFYTPGEGLGGVSVVASRAADGATFSTTTWASGGYTLALAPGTYTVTASGGSLGGTVVFGDVVVGSNQNVKRDFVPSAALPFARLSDGRLTVDGTGGSDIVRLGLANGIYSASLNGRTKTFPAAEVDYIEVLTGDGNDLVDASAAAVPLYLLGGGGRDTLVGGAGRDTITGGGGNDSLWGGDGDDRLNGLAGNDTAVGAEGYDRIYGGDGDDLLFGHGGVDRIWGGGGNDVIDGGAANDKLYGEAGSDTLRGGRQNDFIDGGAGERDVLFGDDGTDTAPADDLDERTSIEVLV